VRSAELSLEISGEEGRRAHMQVLAGAARAYYGVLLAEANLAAAQEALRSADADLHRAETVRSAGMSTDVDVLSIRVHRAEVEEQRIRRDADLDVARAALNDALGLPLDTAHSLTTKLQALPLPDSALAEYEGAAVAGRPEAREVKLAASLAQSQIGAAHSSLLPQVGARAVFEADRQRFIDRGGANWLAGVSLQWNLFNGFGDRARIKSELSIRPLFHQKEPRVKAHVMVAFLGYAGIIVFGLGEPLAEFFRQAREATFPAVFSANYRGVHQQPFPAIRLLLLLVRQVFAEA
jgi:outer membrane protein TolC